MKPNTPEWKSLSVEEKNQMLQITEDKLKKMPTEVLIQAYIDNPFCSLMFAYNTSQDGFKRVCKEFNGLRELLKRVDRAQKLIEFYKNMQADGYDKSWDLKTIGEFTFKFTYIEILLSQPEIINQIRNSDVKIITNELVQKYNKKAELINKHSIIGLESCAYAVAHILNQRGKLLSQADDAIELFLKTGHVHQNGILDKIMQKAIQTINE
ncbi:MAG: hypothetical protein ACM3MI_09780 [Clostridiales bacterium]